MAMAALGRRRSRTGAAAPVGEMLRRLPRPLGAAGMARGGGSSCCSPTVGAWRSRPARGADCDACTGSHTGMIWANPRKARPVSTLAAGRRRHWPSVDAFVEGHSLARAGATGGRGEECEPSSDDSPCGEGSTAMRSILPALKPVVCGGSPFGLATVVAVSRSTPRDRERPWPWARTTRSWAACPGGCVEARSSSWPRRCGVGRRRPGDPSGTGERGRVSLSGSPAAVKIHAARTRRVSPPHDPPSGRWPSRLAAGGTVPWRR